MGRKGKNRPPKLASLAGLAAAQDDLSSKMANEQPRDQAVNRSKKAVVPTGVNFELEADAEQLFLESLAKFDERGLRPEDKVSGESKVAMAARAKSRQRSAVLQVSRTIDLHGLTVEEAKATIDRELQAILAALPRGERLKLRIVTGRGRHSGRAGAVLPREIHRYMRQTYLGVIAAMDESPAELVVGELPIRGHFDVVIIR